MAFARADSGRVTPAKRKASSSSKSLPELDKKAGEDLHDDFNWMDKLVKPFSESDPIVLEFKEEQNKAIKKLKTSKTSLEKMALIESFCIIEIPIRHGKTTLYVKFNGSIDGVTPKVTFISIFSALTIFKEINSGASFPTISVEAILKLPKHDKASSIQREAIALSISRQLGLATTDATMVSYNNKPALFIPFKKIVLLQKVASGDEETTYYGLGLKKFINNATIKPIGEGLIANTIIQDMGKMVALMYVCCDPDSIGGYLQNKAFIGNSPFIFDQGVCSGNYFKIDVNANLYLTSYISTRHIEGRNKSVIEDSSLSEKIEGLWLLIKNKERILSLFDTVIDVYKNYLSTYCELYDDAIRLKKIIEERINTAFKAFPLFNDSSVSSLNPDEDKENIMIFKQVIMLEKLMKPAMLFTKDGRPYRYPLVEAKDFRIKNISIERDGFGRFSILEMSSEKDVIDLAKFLDNKGIRYSTFKNNNNIKIYAEKLQEVSKKFISACFTSIEKMDDYRIAASDFKELSKLYNVSEEKSTVELCHFIENSYINAIKFINEKEKRNAKILMVLLIVIEQLKKYKKSKQYETMHKGYFKHALKKLHFNIIRQITLLIRKKTPELEDKVIAAFNAALKLDRLEAFNTLVVKALKANYVLNDFFDQSIELAKTAVDYDSAVLCSQSFVGIMDDIVKKINAAKSTVKMTRCSSVSEDSGSPSSRKSSFSSFSLLAASPLLLAASSLRAEEPPVSQQMAEPVLLKLE